MNGLRAYIAIAAGAVVAVLGLMLKVVSGQRDRARERGVRQGARADGEEAAREYIMETVEQRRDVEKDVAGVDPDTRRERLLDYASDPAPRDRGE